MGGAACTACGADERCDASSGTCMCDATTCPHGCCDANGSCVAYQDQAATQCGDAGLACAACSAGQVCGAAGVCECTAASCDGWCHGAACEAFETIATDQATFPPTRGIALRNSDVYWVGSSSSDATSAKWRVQRRLVGKSVETVLSNQPPAFGPVLLGAQRLFALNTQTADLFSMKPDGTDEAAVESAVPAFRYRSGRIYWPEVVVSRFREIHIKSQNEVDAADVVDEYSTIYAGTATFADIAFAGTQIAYGLNVATNAGEVGNYELWVESNGSTSQVFPTRAGHLEQFECDADSNYYWRARASATGGADLIEQNDGAPSSTAISSGVDVTDFSLFQPTSGKTLVYYAYTDSTRHTSGIRLYDTAAAKSYDVVTGDQAGSLTTDDKYLYFFESNGHRLVRTPLPHVALGLGK